MATLDNHTYYNNGSSGATTCIGYESKHNRVVRFSFTTGSSGATSISINITAGTIQNVGGADLTSIPFYVTTSSTSHANANAADGFAVTGYITGSSAKAYSGRASIVLKANTTYYLWFFPKNKTYGFSYWHRTNKTNSYYTTATISGTSKYSLSISAGTGSSITVNRTSSQAGASTGNLSNGAAIYTNDKLKITFSPKTNYSITTHKVNNSSFTSGGTHTVSGNVSVSATATPLKSTVGATDANIGSTSTITVKRYNTSYTHTITYKFGSATGTVCTKSTSTSIAWTVPTSFYAQIPNSKSGTCTLTIETFNGASSLGTNTCTLTVTAPSASCSPTVNGTVVDTNATTIALTGDSSILIKYKSTALCSLTATRKNSATISTVKINGATVAGTVSADTTTAAKSFSEAATNSFKFEATDSRGFSSSKTITPSMINYIQLTINPVISRPSHTGSDIVMTFNGNYYRGSFGAYSNTLTIRYRYKESAEPAYTEQWHTIAPTDYILGTNSFRTNTAILLGSDFDYQKSYEFQVQAYDGANGTKLTTVNKYIPIQRGIPVFDWGENDFNFHVPVKLGDTTLTEEQLKKLLALIT